MKIDPWIQIAIDDEEKTTQITDFPKKRTLMLQEQVESIVAVVAGWVILFGSDSLFVVRKWHKIARRLNLSEISREPYSGFGDCLKYLE